MYVLTKLISLVLPLNSILLDDKMISTTNSDFLLCVFKLGGMIEYMEVLNLSGYGLKILSIITFIIMNTI